MDDETLRQESALELKYKATLDAIAAGSSWEKVIADSALDEKPGRIRRFFTFLGDNLAVFASLIVAGAGLWFGVLQYETVTALRAHEISQKEQETKIAKVQALQQLIPSLTSKNDDVRSYAIAALLTLYPYSAVPGSADNKELSALLENIGQLSDADTIAAFATRLNDAKLKKKAAELYAIRSERLRHQTPDAQNDEAKRFNAVWSDAMKALELDSENARAMYQVGRIMQDRQDLTGANEKFEQVIKLVEGGKYPRDDEIYLRSYLQKAVILLQQRENKFQKDVCESYKSAATHYAAAGLEINWDAEAKSFKNGCRPGLLATWSKKE
jgi:hypothetical protein